ncbi:hypothetical protein COOONC_18029 [Cooperia oncophora]
MSTQSNPFHPWPPGSAKWQLQQYLKGSGPPPTKQLKATPPPVIHKQVPSPISPGHLISPTPSRYSKVGELWNEVKSFSIIFNIYWLYWFLGVQKAMLA